MQIGSMMLLMLLMQAKYNTYFTTRFFTLNTNHLTDHCKRNNS